MSEDLTFQFPYLATEHSQALYEIQGGPRYYLIVLGVIVPMWFFIVLQNDHDLSLLWQLFPAALLLLSMLPVPRVMRRWQRWKFGRDNADEIGSVLTMRFSEEGFTPTAKWSRPVPWSKVQRITETKNFVVLHATSDGPYFIPKHAISLTDMTRLRALLQRQFQDRKKKLKLRPAIA